MNMVEDYTLVSALYDDDMAAFDALYYKYHQAIYSNIYKFTKDHDASLDILQDVFTVLWEKRMEIKPDQSVSGWLFVLSFNRSISYLRKKLRETTYVNTLPFAAISEDTDGMRIIDDQYHLLLEAVNQLSPQKRKVFTLCKLEGKTYEEAAEKLNISKHTVKEYLGLSVISVKNHIKQHQETWKTVALLLFCLAFGQ